MEMNNALNQSKVQVEELKSLNEVKKNLKGIVGIENSLPVFTYNKICDDFTTKLTEIVESSRIIKSDYEVKCIESAIEIAERSFINTEISETENKVAARIRI